MVLEYFTLKRGASQSKKPDVQSPESQPQGSPILNGEYEKFLERVTSEEQPPPLPERPRDLNELLSEPAAKNAQDALMDGANMIPLPTSPPEVREEELDAERLRQVEEAEAKEGEKEREKERQKEEKERVKQERKEKIMSFLPRMPSMRKGKAKEDTNAATPTTATTDEPSKSSKKRTKSGFAFPTQEEAQLATSTSTIPTQEEKDREDLTSVLDQLNLSAVNNRAFSFSKESNELLDKFKLVLKDLINGVPTAYEDLEKLLKESNKQLDKMYKNMPPFLQNLIKSLPTKFTAALGPEVAALMAEKPGDHLGANATASSSSTGGGSKFNAKKIPNLKKLVTEQGVVASMLRAILNFLKLRFPAVVTGTNVLMSLAVFLLLFVFWYCHKRGRETRLEREAASAATSADVSEDEKDIAGEKEKKTKDDDRKEKEKTKEIEEANEPPITFNADMLATPSTPDTRVRDLPSVLDLPEPKTVPLPQSPEEKQKELVGDKK